MCNGQDGQCPCKPGVMLQDCSMCKVYHYGFDSGNGCTGQFLLIYLLNKILLPAQTVWSYSTNQNYEGNCVHKLIDIANERLNDDLND